MFKQMTEEQLNEVRFLAEKVDEARKSVYTALAVKNITLFGENKLRFEDACMNMWLYNIRQFAAYPEVKVKLPF